MVRKFLKPAVGVFILNLFALATVSAQDPSEGTFTRTADMTSPRERHTATLLDNGKVLITGGNTQIEPATNPTNTAELFDLTVSPPSVTPLSAMSSARSGHTATRLTDGKVLIAGGDTGSLPTGTNTVQSPQYYHRPTGSTEEFDPASEIFTALSSMNVPRTNHTATLLPNGKVLLTGGVDDDTGTVTSTAELFDPLSGTFTLLPSVMISARESHTATLLGNGKVLIAGGNTATGPTSTAELFDPASGTFSPLTMIVGRSDHTATLLPDGKVLIAGGNTATGPTSTAELFDPASEMFNLLSPMILGRSGHSATLLPDTKVLIAGGNTVSGPTDTGETFDPVLQIFVPLIPPSPTIDPTMDVPRYYHRPTLVVTTPDGPKVLITGGITGSGVTNTAELFNPAHAHATISGSWTIVPSPADLAFLHGVTCTSASDCWAVGYNWGETLIERWDGNSWAIVTSPNTSATESNSLAAVTCASASDCWAVGDYYSERGSDWQTLIERWDGIAWTIFPSANILTSAGDSHLSGVTCASASDCWAVGRYSIGISYQILIEHWDGTSWAIVTPLNTPTPWNSLSGVTCTSASDCWAVGYYENGFLHAQTLIEHWDGTAWANVTSPNTSTTQSNSLYAVTCASAFDCWAVGEYFNGGASQTLIERWNGKAWAIVTSPNNSDTENTLYGVTCASASNCWAVGYYGGNGSDDWNLIEHWDGASWSIVPSPSGSFDALEAVTCVSASDCWALGELTEHYTPSPPIPTSVVSRKTHGTAGDFDVDLPLAGNPGIECRSGGSNNDYQMLVTFANAVTFNSAAVTSGTGTISSTSGSGTTALRVNLTGVTNAQTITMTLSGVNNGTKTSYVGVRMGVLIGDVNGNGTVSNTDVAEVKAQVSSPVSAANFRNDVNANGIVSNSDVSVTKAQVSTALP